MLFVTFRPSAFNWPINHEVLSLLCGLNTASSPFYLLLHCSKCGKAQSYPGVNTFSKTSKCCVAGKKKQQCTQISLFLGYTWITSFHLSFKESSCTIAGGAVNHTQWDFHLWLCNLLFAAFFAGFLLLYLSRINITPQLMLLNDCIRMIWGLSGPLSQFLSPVMSVKSIRWKIGRILNETGTEFIKFELI